MNEKREKKSIKQGGRDNRRMILWLLAGGYLIYLAFQLGQSLFAGEVAAGTETVVAWGGCIVFAAIGLALIFLCARMGIRSLKDTAAALDEEEALETKELAEGDENEPETEGE